jgi:hypothetical protein
MKSFREIRTRLHALERTRPEIMLRPVDPTVLQVALKGGLLCQYQAVSQMFDRAETKRPEWLEAEIVELRQKLRRSRGRRRRRPHS